MGSWRVELEGGHRRERASGRGAYCAATHLSAARARYTSLFLGPPRFVDLTALTSLARSLARSFASVSLHPPAARSTAATSDAVCQRAANAPQCPRGRQHRVDEL